MLNPHNILLESLSTSIKTNLANKMSKQARVMFFEITPQKFLLINA